MGYTTTFNGELVVTPVLNQKEIDYLTKFTNTRRMGRTKGPYYVEGSGYHGQGHDSDIINFNESGNQPGLWCKWVPNEDGTALVWDEGEKFYDSAEWMKYLIDHFIGPDPIAKKKHPEEFSFLQGHTCNGNFEAWGEENGDHWMLTIEDNLVYTQNFIEIPGQKVLVV